MDFIYVIYFGVLNYTLKNGSFNLAHSIAFSSSLENLKHKLDSFMYLALSAELAEDKNSHCFILGQEPKKQTRNHDLWKGIKNLSQITYIDLSEKEKVLEHFEKKGVKPIFSN